MRRYEFENIDLRNRFLKQLEHTRKIVRKEIRKGDLVRIISLGIFVPDIKIGMVAYVEKVSELELDPNIKKYILRFPNGLCQAAHIENIELYTPDSVRKGTP